MHETEPLFLQGSSYTGSPHSMIPKASYWGRKGSVLISLKPTGDWRLVSHSSAMVREIQFAPLEWWVLAAQRHNCNQRHRSAAPDATTPFSLSYGEVQWDIDPNTLPPGGILAWFLHFGNLGWLWEWSKAEAWARGGKPGADPTSWGTGWYRQLLGRVFKCNPSRDYNRFHPACLHTLQSTQACKSLWKLSLEFYK